MRQSLRFLGAAAALVAVALVVRADEEKIPLDKLPKAVVEAVKAKFEGAVLKGAEKETKKGKTYYEVAFTLKGKRMEATFTEDGKIVEIEKEIAVTALPGTVKEAIQAKYPGAKVKKAEEITRGKKKLYEAVIVTADKKTFEIVFDSTGKIVKTEEKGKTKEKKE